MQLLLARKGLAADTALALPFEQYQEQQYDILAAGLRRSLDMDAVYRILDEKLEG